jgi:CheY-like chemotaxis protein
MSTATSLRVVLADDDAFARRVIKHALEAAGTTVVAEAENGYEAVELGLMCRPDVVIVDVVMPRLDGILATRRILNADPDLLVVALTGPGEDGLALQALRAGATAVVPKDDFAGLPRAVEAAGRGEWAIARAAG